MADFSMHLADPTGQIEQECAQKEMTQKSVALTYALAIRDQHIVPVNWARANAAIMKRWPKGLPRVKEAAWKMLREQAGHRASDTKGGGP